LKNRYSAKTLKNPMTTSYNVRGVDLRGEDEEGKHVPFSLSKDQLQKEFTQEEKQNMKVGGGRGGKDKHVYFSISLVSTPPVGMP
jgi:hypothetical protein